MLSRIVLDGLRPSSRFRGDFAREPLPMHIGETLTKSRLSMFDVDLTPANPTGEISYASFSSEQFTAHPLPYSKGFKIDGPTAYVQVGNYFEQNIRRIVEWGARTSNRLSRGSLSRYFGGRSIVKQACTSGVDTKIYLNSLQGFRRQLVNGVPTDISAGNPMVVTVVAATTFTASAIGTAPDNPSFPDGPGFLLLSAAVTANIAGNSYVQSPIKPFSIVAGGRASTEALLKTDWPVLADIMRMLAALKDRGIPRHASTGTYHLHADASFKEKLAQDPAWRQAFQGAGLSPILGAGAELIPQLGITLLENNDSWANGKGKQVHVGALASDASSSMQDVGMDVINSSGVFLRRAILTGDEVGYETYIDESKYFSELGINPIGKIYDNVTVFGMAGGQMVVAEVEGWRLSIIPALDPRQLSCTVGISLVADWTLQTDANNAATANDTTPLKRAVGLEYGNDWG